MKYDPHAPRPRMDAPSAQEVRSAREAAGLTQGRAAILVSVTLSTWQKWEYGRHAMPRALFDLFIKKTKQI